MEDKTPEQLKEDLKKESRKRKIAEIYKRASFIDKIKITIRCWFEK